ncbi:hypothetical protein ACQEV9_15665 [Streptomyces chartreusis]|uniref:hypothetical protein n=1 Tax=Streptomyces chartreusis TaxID=1969 RepID=UPI003D8DCA93
MSENPNPAESAPANGPADGTAAPATGPATTPADNTPGAEALGDAGKKALDAMKSNWHSERDRRKELEQRIADLEAAKSAPDPRADRRIIRAELKAAAAGKFADVSDVFNNVDLTQFEVNEDGDVDASKLNAAIEDLLTRKPHLAATKRPRFEGSGDGGASGRESGPSQLTRADLKGKSPEWIAKAKAEGRLNTLLGLN